MQLVAGTFDALRNRRASTAQYPSRTQTAISIGISDGEVSAGSRLEERQVEVSVGGFGIGIRDDDASLGERQVELSVWGFGIGI